MLQEDFRAESPESHVHSSGGAHQWFGCTSGESSSPTNRAGLIWCDGHSAWIQLADANGKSLSFWNTFIMSRTFDSSAIAPSTSPIGQLSPLLYAWSCLSTASDHSLANLLAFFYSWMGDESQTNLKFVSKVSPRAGAMGEWTKHLSMTPRQHDFRQPRFHCPQMHILYHFVQSQGPHTAPSATALSTATWLLGRWAGGEVSQQKVLIVTDRSHVSRINMLSQGGSFWRLSQLTCVSLCFLFDICCIEAAGSFAQSLSGHGWVDVNELLRKHEKTNFFPNGVQFLFPWETRTWACW